MEKLAGEKRQRGKMEKSEAQKHWKIQRYYACSHAVIDWWFVIYRCCSYEWVRGAKSKLRKLNAHALFIS